VDIGVSLRFSYVKKFQLVRFHILIKLIRAVKSSINALIVTVDQAEESRGSFTTKKCLF
jgi:hypothetical protein